MYDVADIEKKLRALSERQCQVLYWVFQGLEYVEIGNKLGYEYKTIQGDMSKLYKVFGLTPKSVPQKRHILGSEIRPVYENLVKNPETNCPPPASANDNEPPDPEVLKEVEKDAKEGLLPLRALIRVPQPEPIRPPPPPLPRNLISSAPRQVIDITPPRKGSGNSIPEAKSVDAISLVLNGILGALLFVALAVIAYLIWGVPHPQISETPQNTPPPIPQTVVVHETVIVPNTVVVQQTVVVTQIETAIPQPRSTPIPPTLAPPDSPTATPASVDQQSPPPGSNIPVGEGYTRSGVSVTLQSPISIGDNGLAFGLLIENRTSKQIVVLWKNSFIHVRDDKNQDYPQPSQNNPAWLSNKQFTIDAGSQRTISSDGNNWGNSDRFDIFSGRFDPSTKYIIITVDQLIGMKDLTWRYDLQQ